MSRIGRSLTAATVILLFCAAPKAGELSPELRTQIAGKAAGEKVKVWISLPSARDEAGLKKALVAASASRAERHRQGIAQLKAEHGRQQEALLNRLNQMKAAGQADKIKGHWLTNIVEAEVSAGQLTALANRSDIDMIYAVPTLELVEPTDLQPSPTSPDSVTTTLKTINADDAWHAGYTGQGRVICSFDTGIDGHHPALYNNWKGLDGDSAAAWFDEQYQQSFPHYVSGASTYYHGTHVMGIMCGHDDATGDTVGVALDAKWISAAVIDILGAPILDAFEWAADPDGDPNTIADVPDVINHSWGVKGVGCQNLFYNMIDNLEALGIVNIFAAGNEGALAMTIRNPANRANDSLDCFAVGNLTIATNPPSIESSSSRGPSDCNGAIKPNVCAPGTTILSTAPNGAYTYLTGTSMAAPHVSGLVALLRQKNPNATVDQIKTAILTTTNKLGRTLPDNNYGWGMIDCMAALNALPSPPATPVLRVYDYDHNTVLPGATVSGTLVLKNLGANASSVAVTITGTDPALSVISGAASFGSILKNDTVRSATALSVQVDDTVTAGRLLSADLQITAAGYSTSGKLFFVVEPALARQQFNLGVTGNQIRYTITNYGTYGLGPESFFPFHGIGLTVGNTTYNDIYESGFAIATGPAYVSDGLRNGAGEPDGDFAISPGGDLTVTSGGQYAAQEAVCRFNDSRAEQPIGLDIELHTYAFDSVGYDGFIILQYIVSNPTVYAVGGVEVGQYFDWDPGNYASDAGGWRGADSASWVAYHSGSVFSNFRGVRVVHGTISSVWTANAVLATYYGSSDGFTETEKWNALTSGFATATTFDTARVDITQMVSAGPLFMNPGDVDTVAFAVLTGANATEFSVTSSRAKYAYDTWVLSCCHGLRGNVDNDPNDVLSISDLTYLVSFIFQGGPPPVCEAEANVDADRNGVLSISDLTYLVSAIFQGGPAPLPCGQFSN